MNDQKYKIEYVPFFYRKKKVLSNRMKEIRELRHQNYSYADIAAKLGIAKSTVNQVIWIANKRTSQ
jgi:DNA-directed RNA polymerase specialized sigma subunit